MRAFLVAVIWIASAGCNGNGHVEQRPFVVTPGDDVVNCVCNLTFDNEHCTGGTCYEHFEVQLCLPQSIQMSSSGDPNYSQTVDQYCRATITNTIYHLIKVWNGGWCDYKKPYAPNGGVGSSVQCFAQPLTDGKPNATARDDGTCDTPCPEVACDFDTNCNSVQDMYGNPDLDKCKCSRIVDKYVCPGDPPGDLPTPLFCRAPKNVTLQ